MTAENDTTLVTAVQALQGAIAVAYDAGLADGRRLNLDWDGVVASLRLIMQHMGVATLGRPDDPVRWSLDDFFTDLQDYSPRGRFAAQRASQAQGGAPWRPDP